MIPAPRFDYQAAATPGGVYQGLGALADAATTAHAIRRKSQQDQAIAQQQAMQEEQKRAMGLARLQAEDEHRARMFQGQQDLAARTATHQSEMSGLARLRAQQDQEYRMNPPSPRPKVATPLPPEEVEYRKALTDKAKRETELLGQPKVAAPPRQPTTQDVLKIEEARDSYVRQLIKDSLPAREKAAVVDWGFDKPVEPNTAEELKKFRELAEQKYPLQPAEPTQGLGGLRPDAPPAAKAPPTIQEIRAQHPDLQDLTDEQVLKAWSKLESRANANVR